ncbi:MAG: SurA N-terminal domain-containing protein [Patescibacteria group bacterium]
MDILKKSWFWIIVVALIVAGGILYFNQQEDVALRVNDKTFTYSEFDSIVDQVTQELQMYGMEASSEDLREQAVDRAVQEALLVEHAEDKGVEVSDEEIDDQFDEFMEMYGAETEEEFLSQLETEGIESKEEVNDILKLEVQINKLIDLYSDEVEVTDEELEEAYDKYVDQMEQSEGVEGVEQEVSSFEEMEEDLRSNLIQQKATPLILDEIEKMEEDADIEVLVGEDYIEEGVEGQSMEDMIQPGEGEGGEGGEVQVSPEDVEDGEIEVNPEEAESEESEEETEN